MQLVVLGTGLLVQSPCRAEQYDLNNFIYDLNDWYIQYLTDNILMEAKKQRLNVNIQNAQNDVSLQSRQFSEEFSSATPLAVNMVYTLDAQRLVDQVRQYDLNLVFYHRKPLDEVLSNYSKTWYVGVSAKDSGYAQGLMIAEYLKEHAEADKNNDGVVNVMLFKGQATHYSTDIRSRAVLKALRDKGIEYRVMDEYNADFSFELAKRHMENVIKIRGTGPIELIISNCDAMALGALKALNDVGYNLGYSKTKLIPTFGWTGLPEAIEAIRKNKLQGTVAVDVNSMARLILDLALTKKPDLNALRLRYGFDQVTDKLLGVRYKTVRTADLQDTGKPLFE